MLASTAKLLVSLFLLLLAVSLSNQGWTKSPTRLNLEKLVQRVDLIVIARIVKVEHEGEIIRNTLAVEKVLKGKWPLKNPLVLMTPIPRRPGSKSWVTGSLGKPDSRKVVFLIKDPDGKVEVFNSYHSVWDFEAATRSQGGEDHKLDQLQKEIKRQGQKRVKP